MAGCGTVKSWLGINKEDQKEQLVPPPSEGEVAKNPDGSYDFSDDQLTAPRGESKSKWIMLSIFLVSTGLIVRHVLTRKKG
jgi:hypothetical protein